MRRGSTRLVVVTVGVVASALAVLFPAPLGALAVSPSPLVNPIVLRREGNVVVTDGTTTLTVPQASDVAVADDGTVVVVGNDTLTSVSLTGETVLRADGDRPDEGPDTDPAGCTLITTTWQLGFDSNSATWASEPAPPMTYHFGPECSQVVSVADVDVADLPVAMVEGGGQTAARPTG